VLFTINLTLMAMHCTELLFLLYSPQQLRGKTEAKLERKTH